MSISLTRADYVRMGLDELQRRLRGARERIARADTTDAALQDLFAEQELCAAIEKSGGEADGHQSN